MDISLLEKIRALAIEGLTYASDDYDLARYKKLLDLLAKEYSFHFQLPNQQVMASFLQERGCLTPKVGIEVIVPDNLANVLVLRRSDDHRWGLPGGWVDIGESPADAGMRETFEETGIRVSLQGYLAVTSKGPELYPGFTHQVNILLVSAPVPSDHIVKLTHEHDEYKWVHDQSKLPWHPGHDTLVRAALEYLEHPEEKTLLPFMQHLGHV